jgi:hypothetical protein
VIESSPVITSHERHQEEQVAGLVGLRGGQRASASAGATSPFPQALQAAFNRVVRACEKPFATRADISLPRLEASRPSFTSPSRFWRRGPRRTRA